MSRGYIGTDSGKATKPTMFCERPLCVLHGQPMA
jgi:hypothetical protein